VPRAALAPLGLLFGALYFLQGIVEPGDGLIAQPTRALLERRGLGAGSIGDAMLLSSLPWAMKPLFGVLSDALPIGGSRRRAWLALVSAAAAAALGVLALAPVEPAGGRSSPASRSRRRGWRSRTSSSTRTWSRRRSRSG
jgi:hypothetical protein